MWMHTPPIDAADATVRVAPNNRHLRRICRGETAFHGGIGSKVRTDPSNTGSYDTQYPAGSRHVRGTSVTEAHALVEHAAF
jgi:hypothetical protein